MSEVLEFSVLTLKEGQGPDLPQSFLSDLKTLASAPGVVGVYHGPQIEDPSKFTVVTRWSSPANVADFQASSGFGAWITSFVAPLETIAVTICRDLTGDADAALGAPCTEILSNFGADDDFLETRLNPFLNAVREAKLPGWLGGITGEFPPLKYINVEEPEPKTVVLMLGWNSIEDHKAQRGEGKVIDNNIHLIRSGRKSTSMFHANLQKI